MHVGCLPNGSRQGPTNTAQPSIVPTRGEGREMTGKHAYSTQPSVSKICSTLALPNAFDLIQALVGVLLDTAGRRWQCGSMIGHVGANRT